MAQLTEREALDLIRATATRSFPEMINLAAIDRILADVVAPPAPLADEPVRCMIVETGGQDFVCAITDWTESGQSLGEFLRQQAGVLPDDYENLSDVVNIHMDTRTATQLANLPEYNG